MVPAFFSSFSLTVYNKGVCLTKSWLEPYEKYMKIIIIKKHKVHDSVVFFTFLQ